MRTVLLDFKNSLARVRDIADDVDKNISSVLSDPLARNRYETARCAATVILSGFFESFLKQLAEKCVSAICNLNRPFASLPDRLRYSHYEFGGTVLTRRTQDERSNRSSRIQASADDISFRLASVATMPYDLVWEAFAETQANPSSETVGKYLKRFGIGAPWQKIASIAGTSAGVLKTELDSFVSLRHECAHTGTATTVSTPSEIRGFCDLLERLADAIVRVLEDYLATL